MSQGKANPTRLFRVSSPSDIICASIVADVLPPGNNILAVSTDKSHAELEGYRECYRSLAKLHPWKKVVDLSGIPIVSQYVKVLTLRNRLRGVGLFIASIRDLRSRLASALSLPASAGRLKDRVDQGIDELYLTCPHHPEVQALCQVLPTVRKIYYPHTFDSVGHSEIGHFALACAPRPFSVRSVLINAFKRVVWGEDAVPLLRVKIDTAYSFRLPFPWADEQVALNELVNSGTMLKTFSALPIAVQDYFQGIAAQCGTDALGLLLINAEDFPEFIPAELEAYQVLARQLADRCGGGTILVKPHSRGGGAHTDRVLSFLRSRLPDIKFVPILEYHFYPIEVVLAPFHPVACGGLGTTSLRTLGMLYGIDAYCPISRIRAIYKDHAKFSAVYDRWIDDYASSVIEI